MEQTVNTVQRACFELGIKCGSLYHQFAGTPVSPTSATSLERAMAESIENQPYCTSVAVTIDREKLAEAIDPTYGYVGLTGTLLDWHVVVEVDGVRVVGELVEVDGYPEMRITDIQA